MNCDKALKFLKMAKFQADLFSKDPNTKVGCIIVAPDSLQILSCGYNGLPRNIDESIEERWKYPLKAYFCEHSERNCLYNACRSGVKLENSIAVVSLYPCHDCARGLIQAGITTVVTIEPNFEHERWGYSFKISECLFKEAGINVITFTKDDLNKN